MDDHQVANLESRLASLERRIWLLERLLWGVWAMACLVGATVGATRAMGWPGLVPLLLAIVIIGIGAKRAEDEEAWLARRAPALLVVAASVTFLMGLIHWSVAVK